MVTSLLIAFGSVLIWLSLFFFFFGKKMKEKTETVDDVLLPFQSEVDRQMNEMRKAQSQGDRLGTWLKQTKTGVTPSTFVLMMLGFAAILGLAFAYMVPGVWLIPLAAALAGAFLPIPVVKFLHHKAVDKFDRHMASTTRRMASLLRSGLTFPQVVEEIAKSPHVPHPVRLEFVEMLRHIEAGMSMEDVLYKMAESTGSAGAFYLAVAISALRKSGANIADATMQISYQLSSRHITNERTKALLAGLQFTSFVLTGMPFLIYFSMKMTSPDYFTPALNTSWGPFAFGAIFAVIGVGFFVFQKASKVE